MNWNQPMCEACWIEAEGEWDLAADGFGQVLIGLRRPVIVLDAPIERCSWCGKPTIVGIYKRAHPNTVPYPAPEEP